MPLKSRCQLLGILGWWGNGTLAWAWYCSGLFWYFFSCSIGISIGVGLGRGIYVGFVIDLGIGIYVGIVIIAGGAIPNQPAWPNARTGALRKTEMEYLINCFWQTLVSIKKIKTEKY